MVVVIIVAAAGLGVYYYNLKGAIRYQDSEKQSLMKQQILLSATINLQADVDTLTVKVRERINIIKELTSDSDLRFAMLQHINSILPENLWLTSIVEKEDKGVILYTLEGMSYTKEDISGFLMGLEKYDKFRNVALQSIKPSPMEIRDAYQYVVSVQLAGFEPPPPPKEKALPSKQQAAVKK